ncbi:MAG: hypothetical protein AAF799_23985 [Myxococcota bacterium]
MNILKPSGRRALIGALAVLPLCVQVSSARADGERAGVVFRDIDFTITQTELHRFTHEDRTIIVTTNVANHADGTTVQDATDVEAFQAITAVISMLHGNRAIPGVPPVDRLEPSDTASTLILNATANNEKTVEIRVGHHFAGTEFATTLVKRDPTDRSVILLNMRRINILLECLEQLAEVRDDEGNVSVPDSGVLKVLRLTALIHIISRQLVQADSNLEIANVGGQDMAVARDGLLPATINHIEPVPRPESSPVTPQGGDQTVPLTQANAVANEMLPQGSLNQTITSYLQTNGVDAGPGGEVADFTIVSRRGAEQTITVLLHELTTKKSIAETVEDEIAKQRFEEFKRRKESGGCNASAAVFELGAIEQITELPSPTPTQVPTPTPDGVPTIDPDSETDSTTGGETDFDTTGFDDTTGRDTFTSETDTDFDTTGRDPGTTGSETGLETDGDTDETTGGFEETDTDESSSGSDGGGPVRFPCVPSSATFSGTIVPQAGIDIDFLAPDCVTISGFPPGDQLVIDDFGAGTFGGSGASGVTVVSISEGTSFNDPGGFFVIGALPVGVPIELVLEDAAGNQVTITFTIVQGVGGMPSQLVDTQVSVGP